MTTQDHTVPTVPRLLGLSSLLSILFGGAIFGFFYAWVCSTMWGLDTADPAVAIAAMQAMNASVRNVVFAPAFFGTPVVLIVTALLAFRHQRSVSALALAASAAIYLGGAFVTTMAVNVPMNEALAAAAIPQDTAAAARVWQDYSGPWQVWNRLRTIMSGLSLMLTGYAVLHLGTVSKKLVV
jgi:uncharacterized membrane protein